MADLRIGVLGHGLRGGLARVAHRPGAGSRVTALADPGPAARAEAAEDFPVSRPAPTPGKSWPSPTPTRSSSCPDHTHAGLAREALHAREPVLVEKPRDITVDRCDQVLRTADETGTRLYVGHDMRHMPVIRLMRDLVEGGAIGTVKTVWVRHFAG